MHDDSDSSQGSFVEESWRLLYAGAHLQPQCLAHIPLAQLRGISHKGKGIAKFAMLAQLKHHRYEGGVAACRWGRHE
jgi:hypothetical protein